jgi:heme oxygenase
MNAHNPLTNRDLLIARTRATHEALHYHPVLAQLFNADFSSQQYTKLLAAYYGFYAAVEAERRALNCWPELTLKPAVEHLLADLNTADTNVSVGELAPVSINDQISCLASLYVLHGARAGASVIAKHLQSQHPSLPANFFAAPRDQSQWRGLLAAINAITDSAELETLCAVAQRTFTEFGQWLSLVPAGGD